MTINDIYKQSEDKMKKSMESLRAELSRLRAGRAHPSLLDHVMIDYYGENKPLSQVASITVSDARTLMIAPWEKNMVAVIEKAILTSDLGLNPVTTGQTIRVPLPQLSEDRRKELIKVIRQEGENARVAVRSIRRDANHQLKELTKEKVITEDEERRTQDRIQKLTDQSITEIDKILAAKETGMMEI